MAIEYFDGFDDYNTSQEYRYWVSQSSGPGNGNVYIPLAFNGNAAISASNGRNSTASLRYVITSLGRGQALFINISSTVTKSIGFAFKTTAFSDGSGNIYAIATFADSLTGQCTLVLEATGVLSVYRGVNGSARTLLGSSSLSLLTSTWYYIEWKLTVDPTTGVVTVNVNGVPWITLTGQNTRSSSNNSMNQVILGWTASSNTGGSASGMTLDYDDFYIDSTGTFYGDQRVESIFPTGLGATNNFTASTGTNYSCVNNNPSDDDTTYISSSAINDIDLYTFPALGTTTGTVNSLMTITLSRADNAQSIQLASVYRVSATNYFGTTNYINESYIPCFNIQSVNPNTSAAWTISTVNSAQFGIKRIA